MSELYFFLVASLRAMSKEAEAKGCGFESPPLRLSDHLKTKCYHYSTG